MSTKARIVTTVGVLMMLGLYFLPMWYIRLEAPQYPGDLALGIKIHIDKVVGAKEMDLENINGLNHYVGMKAIEPDAIPELTVMPYVVAGLIAIGLLAAFLGRRWLVMGWIGLVCATGAVGLYDFWKWEYDYGHNLDPHAIIKIPDMYYQPPLIGTEQLLNFTASSYPDIAFYMMMAGLGMATCAVFCLKDKKISAVTGSTLKPSGKEFQANSTPTAVPQSTNAVVGGTLPLHI